MDKDLTTKCKNCGAEQSGNFCVNCGQRSMVHKVTFKETFQDLNESLFSINAPLLLTLKMLLTRPGILFREYLDGKRKKYYKPVSFFIVMTATYLVLRWVIQYDPFGSTTLQVVDETTSQILTRARNFMLLNIDKLLFVFVLSLSIFMKLFFNKKYSFPEFLAVSFYLSGIYTFLTTLTMCYVQFIDSSVQALHILVMFLYFIFAMVSFFPEKKFWVIVKSILVFTFAFFFYGFLAYGLSVFIIWIQFN